MEGLLNLTALRKNSLPRYSSGANLVTKVAEKVDNVELTRRQMLKLTGVFMGSAAGLKSAGKIFVEPLGIVETKSRVAFKTGNQEKWVIDVKHFGGQPVLKVTRGENQICLELKNAHYPGTDIPADIKCELKKGIVGWRLKLKSAICDFPEEVSLENWLAGEESIQSTVNLKELKFKIGTHSGVVLAGKTNIEYFPDWTIDIKGSNDIKGLKVCKVVGVGDGIITDCFNVTLGSGKPSALSNSPIKRTLISFDRGDCEWTLIPEPVDINGWGICPDNKLFDAAIIEVGQTKDGSVQQALVAQTKTNQMKLCVRPEKTSNQQEQAFELGLRNARYAVASDLHNHQTALMAEYDDQPRWLHLDGYSLQLGGNVDAPPFEVVRFNDEFKKVVCTPPLIGMLAPLPDAIVEITTLPKGTRYDLLSNQNSDVMAAVVGPENNLDSATGNIDTGATGNLTAKVPNLTVSVLRPKDFLVLTFEFINLKKVLGNLVRIDQNKTAYIVVHFPPQSIAEEAIYETSSEGYGQPTTVPENSRNETAQTSNDTNLANHLPPVQTRLSGPSRLAFLVPEKTTQIPYTLKELLNWRKYGLTLSVVPAAKPPQANADISDNDDDTSLENASGIPWQELSEPELTEQNPLDDFDNPVNEIEGFDRRKLIRDPFKKVSTNPSEYMGMYDKVLTFNDLRTITKSKNLSDTMFDASALTQEFQVMASSSSNRQSSYTTFGDSPIAGSRGDTVTKKKSHKVDAVLDNDELKCPNLWETAIEMPYRLIMSPHKFNHWAHSVDPVNHDRDNFHEPYELWHTRLGVLPAVPVGGGSGSSKSMITSQGQIQQNITLAPVDEKTSNLRTLRAIWSPDYEQKPNGHANNPFRMSLDAKDRYELVRLTSDFHIGGYSPIPVNAKRLMLTSLGAWMDIQGKWNPPDSVPELDIEAWKHQATMGRDHFVKVVYKGYLFPFGHRASLIKVTERKIQRPNATGSKTAYLRQRMYIVVREPEKVYPLEAISWEMPLRRIVLKTEITPMLDVPQNNDVVSNGIGLGQEGFWPHVNSMPFKFHLMAEDWDGRICEFSAPLIFVSKGNAIGSDNSVRDSIKSDYQNRKYPNNSQKNMCLCDLSGQKVTYTPIDSGQVMENQVLETDCITFSAKTNVSVPAGQPKFVPLIKQAKVKIPALAQLAGSAAEVTGTANGKVDIEWHNAYLSNGFSCNQTEVFAQLVTKPKLSFGSDKIGGMVKPSMDITGISRSRGPISGSIAQQAGGTLQALDLFDGSASFLGGIKLVDILAQAQTTVNVPELSMTYEYQPGQTKPSAAVVNYHWTPKLRDKTGTVNIYAAGASMEVTAKLRKALNGQSVAKAFEITANIQNFKLDFCGLIGIRFNYLTYTSTSGCKPDVQVSIDKVEFLNELAFINDLKDFLAAFGDGLFLDIGSTGLVTGFNLAIPSIPLGMFSLQNITLGTALSLPFDGRPLGFSFKFCTRENPFLLTVSAFGGGGYFLADLDAHGITKIEGALEFGASLSMNILGLAQGTVYAMGGVYFGLERINEGTKLTFSAYLRMGGALSVLGLITVSIEFYLQLQYQTKDSSGVSRLVGEASVTVEVEVLFFSKSVTLSVRRELAGADPKFTDMVSESDWQTYCRAFA